MPKVLIVDDDEPYRFVLERGLKQAGYDTVAFTNANDALNFIDGGGAADALVPGLQLPPGTPNGLSLALMTRRRLPRLPIVLITGLPDLEGDVPGHLGRVMRKDMGADRVIEALQADAHG